MDEFDCDVAILGTGFGGSLTALILRQAGLRPLLIERGTHPRFAIGESSTPIANLVLRDLARRYDLPRLAPLAKYGTWQRIYPGVVCGLKRGFSYFKHEPGRRFAAHPDHRTELLVAASLDDQHSDTHWLRADVDAFLLAEARTAGVPYLDRTDIHWYSERSDRWTIAGERRGHPVEITASFLIDATGGGAALFKAFGLTSMGECWTTSRAIYAHFANVRPWQEIVEDSGGRTSDYPFCCDRAALHHILDDGWMWQLRFNNQITSAGFVLDTNRWPRDRNVSPAEEWQAVLKKYPSIAEQFADAHVVAPEGGIQQTGRLQRLASTVAGANWALLPHTAGFVDPLHSTGIAHTLCGIERLTRILTRHWNSDSLADALKEYGRVVKSELELIDELVSGCYDAFAHFRRMVAFSMLYFAGATVYEHRRVHSPGDSPGAFLCADDPKFRRVVRTLWRRLGAITRTGNPDETAIRAFELEVASAIEPFNVAGLFRPEVANMYRYTALPDNA